MKTTAVLLVLIFFLSGCVGLSLHGGDARESEIETDRYYLEGEPKLWSESEHPADGNIIIESEIKWCGSIVWAIVPIPLMLPVCKSYTEVNFSNNLPTTRTKVSPKLVFMGCGPGVLLLSAIVHDMSPGFCSYHEE